ncbi:MAG: SagB/ThcOx family dehydrogenase, partial [Patescibacteria group bacterium]
EEAILRRESSREFASTPILLSELSDLLYYSTGLKIWEDKGKHTKRVYPSAGGRYPLEVYPFIFKVSEVPSGVYHYHLKTHSLELILEPPFIKTAMKQFNQSWIKRAGAIFVITAMFDRTLAKYSDRGYRHILTEYGHVAQNFYLMSSALDLGCCSIGGFIDNGLNDMLDIDGIDEGVVGVLAIGSKKEKSS